MIREPEDVSNRILFISHCHPEERIVTQKPLPISSSTAVPTIAIRKSCHPDGIGLSHYVLMDKKAAK